jgi:CheY-like chemotaxis protein
MLQRLIPEDIELSVLLDDELARVKADLGQIEQVILNIAVNARDAMPQGGKLTIQTANVELDTVYATDHLNIVPGRYVMLAIHDTGCGMDEATKSRIFEPFFTTKEPGKGTGLGLSTVYGIVKQSDGYIEVYSEPGRGSAFKIYLPRMDDPQEATIGDEKNVDSFLGWETILLVDDNELLRTSIDSFLRMMGYKVISAGNAPEALGLSRRHSGPIHLLISDLVMPGMDGSELAERILRERPYTRVLYISGYTEETIRLGNLIQPGTFLQKPASMPVLLRKIREILDAK